MKRKVLTLFCLVCSSAMTLMAAELESTPVPRSSSVNLEQPLTLSAALQRASNLNPALQQAKIAVSSFEGAYRHADTPVPSNPVVSLQSFDQGTGSGQVNRSIGITVSQELWIAGQGGLREQAAGARLQAARQRLDFLSATIAARTRAAFMRALVAREAVETAEQIVNANQDLSDFSELRLESGEANQLEANTARIGLGQAQALLAQAENQFEQATYRLIDLLWLDPAQALELSGVVSPVELEVPGQEELLTRAVQRRSDLAAASEQVMAAQNELKLANRQLIPNLTVFAVKNSDINIDSSVLAGLSFELPVLHRFGGERQQAAAQLDQALLERDSLNLSVRSEILSALSAYRAARRSLSSMSEEVLNSATQNLELTRIAFETGEVDATALSIAQSVLVNTRNEHLRALNDLVVAGTELERASGGILILSNVDSANN